MGTWGGPEPSARDLLSMDIDLRVGVDAWALGWRVVAKRTPATDDLASALRLAYGQGYLDALTESRRGELLRNHRIPVPRRRGKESSAGQI